jgi:hypothetical protein
MNLLGRCVRFYIHESLWWLAIFAGYFILLGWKYWAQSVLLPLFIGAGITSLLPWPFRHRGALNYVFLKRLLINLGFGVLLATFVLRFVGQSTLATFLFAYYLSFTVGFLFWTVTDDIYDMVNWLSHPLEYGRPPDEIHLLAERHDSGTLNRLWRYRYDDEWDVGITGLETFAFEDGRCNSITTDEVFNEYVSWYDREEIEEMKGKAID